MTFDKPVAIAPTAWPWACASPPIACSETKGWRGALIRRWCDTSAVMVQPPLDHHYVVLHMDGPKRVERRNGGPAVSALADEGSLTLVPAGSAFTWRTSGPIAFAHLYLRPAQIEHAVREMGGRSIGRMPIDRVAFRDHLLEPLLRRMLTEIERSSIVSAMRLDCLLEAFVLRLVRSHVPWVRDPDARTVALAPHRLRRVLEFIEARLAHDISLADLVAAAGSSQFHFSHAFRIAMGISPYRYLIARRIECAKVLLATGDEPLDAVSRRCGFNSRHQFAVMFKRHVGTGPKRYRMGWS